MKKVLLGLITLMIMALFCQNLTTRTYAQAGNGEEGPILENAAISQGTTEVQRNDAGRIRSEDVVSFEYLGLRTRTLDRSMNSVYIPIQLPQEWVLMGDAELQLDIMALISRYNAVADGVLGGFLIVEFNGATLDSILINQNGPQTLSIPIPQALFTSKNDNAVYPLRIMLRSNEDCGSRRETSIVVQPTSRLVLPHRVTSLPTVLGQLPNPIYQGNFLPEAAIVIVPDEPTAGELEAALTAVAAFGQMTESRLAISLTHTSALTPELVHAHHLILVGQSEHLPLKEDVSLPSALDAVNEGGSGHGLLHMAVSPWNQSKVFLSVSGKDEQATIRAAQALGSAVLRNQQQNTVWVDEHFLKSADAEQPMYESSSTTHTLASMGYNAEQLEGPGRDRNQLEFFVSAQQVLNIQELATLYLSFSHSTLLDYEESGLVLQLNDTPIGTVRLDDHSATHGNAQIPIPPWVLQPGYNRLTLQSELNLIGECNSIGRAGAWLSIRPESTLHLPFTENLDSTDYRYTLNDYPKPFALDGTLGATAFVLPETDPMAWNAATQIAFHLGNSANSSIAELSVVYVDQLAESIYKAHNLIIVGKPSTLSVIHEINEDLPAPLIVEENMVREQTLLEAYRLRPQNPLGFIEILPSPWHAEQTILTIFGNSDQGVQNAVNALTLPKFKKRLVGDYAVVTDEELYVTFTKPTEQKVSINPISSAEQTVTGLLSQSVSDNPAFSSTNSGISEVVEKGTENSDDKAVLEAIATRTAQFALSNTMLQSHKSIEDSNPTKAITHSQLLGFLPAQPAWVLAGLILANLVLWGVTRWRR